MVAFENKKMWENCFCLYFAANNSLLGLILLSCACMAKLIIAAGQTLFLSTHFVGRKSFGKHAQEVKDTLPLIHSEH